MVFPRAWTDYWKSQGRKFCDFCKCWIADNRPSIDFHENGKKHKENVSKRLKEIHKNTAKQAKEHKKFESDLKKMEKAAVAAYQRDVENNTMDMTAERLVREKDPMLQPGSFSKNTESHKPPPQPRPSMMPRVQTPQYSNVENKTQGKGKSGKGKGKGKGKRGQDNSRKPGERMLWYEACTPEGYTYYWHIETNESVWEAPEEGFMTIDEQEEEAKSQQIQEEFFKQMEEEEKDEKAKIAEERRANDERQRLKGLRNKEVKIEEEKEEIPYLRDYSVPEKPQPYGAWKTVPKMEQTSVDLQLPAKKQQIAYVPPLQSSEPLAPQRTFKEKIITNLSMGDSDDEDSRSIFKKRKLGNKNVRKRLTDD